ncbi:bifunctional adenosylcobinamide kinase/adenosylcobinamide-phosphate guanylyltransferase [Actinomycetota bacterium]
MRTLVTGGTRSGKSAHAESLLAGVPEVTYVATGMPVDSPEADPDWASRVRHHQHRRPASWRTVDTTDLASAIEGLTGPALIDCLGTWLTAQLDEIAAWESPEAQWQEALQPRVDRLVEAWQQCGHQAVAVTNEVGLSLVSEHRSGRIFADALGRLNQRMAAVSDSVVLVVAGLPLTVKGQ